MDNLIKKSEDIDLSADDINRINNNNSNIIVYHNLSNYHNFRSMFGGKDCVILLYETKQNFGHWVCILEFPSYYEFFENGEEIVATIKQYGIDYLPRIIFVFLKGLESEGSEVTIEEKYIAYGVKVP